MKEQEYELGLIGLGTMGQNLLMNMADCQYAVVGYDKNKSKVDALKEATRAYKITGKYDVPSFVQVLKKPRVVILLVPAGKIVDYVIQDLLPHLEPGDIVIDGGNSHFTDTNRRIEALKQKNIEFVGMGISGGAEGARKGPSMMPGGKESSWHRIQPIFEATAAKVDGEPCVAYMGQGSAGHYVKMVHNGIEYGLMELIAEAYDFMKRVLKMSNHDIATAFESWNNDRLESYLIEITAAIFRQKDALTKSDLIDVIRDESKQKGTGKWTSQDAMNLQVPVPGIDLAVAMRDLSGYKDERAKATDKLSGPVPEKVTDGDQCSLDDLEKALYFSFVITYAQGMAQLRKASTEYNYQLDLATIAKIWRGGCIIRAAVLEDFRTAFTKNSNLENLLLDDNIAASVNDLQDEIRKVAKASIDFGVPIMAMSNAIAYFDAYRSARLPANLIQAQRDFFGSHTYERLDREGVFHTVWGH
ncbi:NADP-dependent phosphogluconate dehydrogenase [Membranicola marinus]|uniref:6-phosphogluconate dehydrogenase, decarboxylating n=1 Tax=Membranihabitans marinus TaxID=1227546 RepID=A0A953L9J6_9BACT|nr:NADP-dependent phosphogluconate dehydrogenase [Membranihabitans marinus]MBY5958920.1 NADP-dependent phosphogluconate dehydrogenase [Membranihabitans marinus]